MNFIIQKLTTNALYSAALTLTCLLIWAYAIYIWIRAKSITSSYDDATVVAQYEPPKGISPILADYLLSFGAQVKTAGDLNKTGEHIMVLICLYERGLLSQLKIAEGRPARIQYQVNPNHATITAPEDEKMFIDRLVKAGGMQGQMTEEITGGGPKTPETPDGFDIINKFWFDYWYKDLRAVTTKLDITSSKNSNYYFLSSFALTITFGAFFAIFTFLFSKVFPPLAFIGFLLILPQTLLYLLCFLVLSLISNLNVVGPAVISILNPIPPEAMVMVTFFSWFAWMIIFGTQVRKIYFRFNAAGKAVLQQLEGYKLYLKEVNTGRIDILRKAENSNINSTTLPWLLVFRLMDYRQWEEWRGREVQSSAASPNLATGVGDNFTFNSVTPTWTAAECKKATRTKNIFGGVILFIGLSASIASAVKVIKDYNYSKTLSTAKGTVLQVQSRNYSCGKNHRSTCTEYIPVIAFTDAAGNNHVFTNAPITDTVVSKTGNEVNVAYEPNNPDKAQVKSAFHQWAGGLFMLGFAGLFSLFGLFIFLGKAVPRGQNLR